MALAQPKIREEKPDFQEVMDVWRELATPGHAHKLLAGRAGRWSTKTRHWMELDEPPMEFSGSCKRKMILDGRFLREKFTGEMMGSPFTGIGTTGYDNHTKKYVMTWIDTLSTGVYVLEGSADEDGRTITLEGRFEDPAKGPGTWRSVTKIVDENTEVSEMRGTYENGGEFKCETTYTRKK